MEIAAVFALKSLHIINNIIMHAFLNIAAFIFQPMYHTIKLHG